MPTVSLGTSIAPVTVQPSGGSSVASMLWCPPWPELILNWARPRRAWTPSSDHPAGTEARQGTDVAEGTVCANRIIRSSVPQVGVPETSDSLGVNMPTVACTAKRATTATVPARSTRLTLQRWSDMGRRSGASARNCATRSRPSRFMTARNCVGLATPRVAAKASAISSAVKYCSARR